MEWYCWVGLIVGAAAVARLIHPPVKKTKEHYTLTVGQAAYLLCLKRDIFGATPRQHIDLDKWNRNGNSGIVILPRLGFEDWEEYKTALQLTGEMANKNNIKIAFNAADVERVWREGVDRTQA